MTITMAACECVCARTWLLWQKIKETNIIDYWHKRNPADVSPGMTRFDWGDGKTDLSNGVKKNFSNRAVRYKRNSFFELWNFSACSADGPRNTLRRINHVHLFALTSKYCSYLISLSCHDYAGTALPHMVNWSTNYLVWSTGICTFCIFNFLHIHLILS